ncbi:MAG: 50S ribosomal protein L6 [Calditrichaceae bacterium]|nr:50S ribosomal protein L6 [Calditrichaceae bacterium]
MSRIGKLPIPISENVNIQISDDNIVTVKGPKGELTQKFSERIKININDGEATIDRKSDEKIDRSLHGLSRALLANMVTGVTEGFTKKMEIIGVGYKAEMKGKKLLLNVGYSHPIIFGVQDEIKLETPSPTEILVSGINKELVGAVSAKIRSFRKPEPYKGKGIKYAGEHIRRKAGKAAGA